MSGAYEQRATRAQVASRVLARRSKRFRCDINQRCWPTIAEKLTCTLRRSILSSSRANVVIKEFSVATGSSHRAAGWHNRRRQPAVGSIRLLVTVVLRFGGHAGV